MTNAANQILIVDDEPPLLKMMSVYLKRLGYGVVTAGSTEKAWAAVEAAPHAFALAVLDATMSGIGMQDLAARILAADPRVCVIACSGQSDVPAQAVYAGDAGQHGAEDDCHARRRRLIPARK
jgi:DNA-binding NtrC family response regulator